MDANGHELIRIKKGKRIFVGPDLVSGRSGCRAPQRETASRKVRPYNETFAAPNDLESGPIWIYPGFNSKTARRRRVSSRHHIDRRFISSVNPNYTSGTILPQELALNPQQPNTPNLLTTDAHELTRIKTGNRLHLMGESFASPICLGSVSIRVYPWFNCRF